MKLKTARKINLSVAAGATFSFMALLITGIWTEDSRWHGTAFTIGIPLWIITLCIGIMISELEKIEWEIEKEGRDDARRA